MIGFDSDSLQNMLDKANEWISNREKIFKDEFRFVDVRFSSASLPSGGGVQYSAVVMYENTTDNESIDKPDIINRD